MMRNVCLAALLVAALVPRLAAQGYVPHRIFDTAARQFTDFESMSSAIAGADVVFVGEQHDDPNTHRLERWILEALAARRDGVVLSLEMFERDTQASLDRFRIGEIDEATFLSGARPWPRYATDYKSLVDFAITRKWPIVAANVPRPFASEVAKEGPAMLAKKSEAERAWFAVDRQCPSGDEYFARFKEAMGGHGSVESVQRYYESQCLKDETMAESIARAWTRAAEATPTQRPLVVHYNGAFHSDFGLGTVSRVQRRLPDHRLVVISVVPLADLDALQAVAPAGDELRRARFLVYTSK